MKLILRQGDCVEVMATLAPTSVRAIISDPPYGISFMGKDWDDLTGSATRPNSTETAESRANRGKNHGIHAGKPAFDLTIQTQQAMQRWHADWCREAYRVLKPGGIIKAFCACYDAETEVLTKRGWVPFPEVAGDDLFASLDPETHKVHWQKPVEIVNQPHDGPMIKYDTNRVDLLVTPNHKMFVAPAVDYKGERLFTLRRADEHPEGVKMTKTSKGRVDQDDSPCFILPASEQSIGPGGMRPLPELHIPWEAWLPFFGLWIAEGSASKVKARTGHGYKVSLSHFDIPNLREVKRLLAPWFNVRIYEKAGKAHINSKQLVEHLQQFGKAWEKSIPDQVKRLSPERIRLFLDWYVRGDGSNETYRCWTTSPHLRDDLQEIAMYAGWAADWAVKRTSTPGKIKGRAIHSRRPYFYVPLLRRQNQPLVMNRKKGESTRTVIPAEEWGGRNVYCVELPQFHTLYVRRGGKAVWCGNTRTYHRLAAAMEDVGFRVTGYEAWAYGNGFPKGLDLSKAVDATLGVEREVVGTRDWTVGGGTALQLRMGEKRTVTVDITRPGSPQGIAFDGYNTALKPSWEPFVVAVKA
jgi:SAM-dependent methyltransferase